MQVLVSSFTVLESMVPLPPSFRLAGNRGERCSRFPPLEPGCGHRHVHTERHTYIGCPSTWPFLILTVSNSKGISQSSLVYIHLHYQCQTCPPIILSLRVSVRYSLHRIIDWSNDFMLPGCPYPRNDTSVQLRNNGGGLVLLQDTQLIETLAHFSRERIPERCVDCLLNSCHSYL